MEKEKTKVLILLSTYNGAKFLQELLDSLFLQKNVDMHYLIRDDGSLDETVNILKQFVLNTPNVELLLEKNEGCINSFNKLIKHACNYYIDKVDYFAFCDQDDVWLEQKLQVATSILDKMPVEKPSLYCSNLILVDEQLNFISNMYLKKMIFTKGNALVERFGTGCTMVFNKEALTKYVYHQSLYPELHDRWIYLICLFFGNIHYDDCPHILYRQHSGNVIGCQNSFLAKWESRFRSFRRLKEIPREQNAMELLRIFKNKLSEEDYELISIVANYKKNFFSKLYFFFAPSRYNLRMRSLERNFWLRIRIIFGSV